MGNDNRKPRDHKEEVKESSTPIEKAVVKATHTPKASKMSSKRMNVLSFCDMIAMNSGTKFWANKYYGDTEIKTAGEWSDAFISKGAIDETPKVLK